MTDPTASDILGWVAAMRQEAAVSPPVSGSIKTPDQIVFELDVIDGQANHAVRVVKEADLVRGSAKSRLLRAEAAAVKGATGANAEVRQASVSEAVADLRDEVQTAEIAYRYATRLADLLDSRKSSLQTQAKLVLATYQTPGSGR